MNIRKATMMDKMEIYEMICDEEAAVEQTKFEQVLWENVNNPYIEYLVGIEDGVVVGFASLHIQKRLHQLGNVGEIQELVIRKSYRRKGLGTQLLQIMKQKAIDLSCIQLEVASNEKSKDAIKFYEKQKMSSDQRKLYIKLR